MPLRMAERVLRRLAEAEACESNPHYQDDIRIARLTVLHAYRGDTRLCSPHVLASYEVLGLHPDKVWQAIQERRSALGISEEFWRDLPPKKPPVSAVWRSQVPLWCEKLNAARGSNSGGASTSSGEPATSVHMAAPSIAALYPNSDAPSSAKSRQYSYREWIKSVRHSFAPQPIRLLTLNALTARGPWPGKDGPADGVICVALGGMQIGDDECGGQVVRSTAQRRLKRAIRENYWRRVRDANSWTNCPKCTKPRAAAKCEGCGYRGRSKNGEQWTGEFMRVPSYEINLEAFLRAPQPKGIREFHARTWKEHKEAAKRGEHPNVTEMPRKPAQPAPERTPDPPTKVEPVKQPAANAETRKPLPITRDVRIAIAGCYTNARKQGKSEDAAVAEVSEAYSSERFVLAPAEVKLQLKIWQGKHGSLDPPQSQAEFPCAPAKCMKCGGALLQNRGAGPRLICPFCTSTP